MLKSPGDSASTVEPQAMSSVVAVYTYFTTRPFQAPVYWPNSFWELAGLKAPDTARVFNGLLRWGTFAGKWPEMAFFGGGVASNRCFTFKKAVPDAVRGVIVCVETVESCPGFPMYALPRPDNDDVATCDHSTL